MELQEYLEEMERNLKAFQEEMKEVAKTKTGETFNNWYFDNNIAPRRYSMLLLSGFDFDDEHERKVAYQKTYPVFVETMNLYYKLAIER